MLGLALVPQPSGLLWKLWVGRLSEPCWFLVLLNLNRRNWGKPLNNLTAITTKIRLHHLWDDEKFILSEFFLPGDPPLESEKAKAVFGLEKTAFEYLKVYTDLFNNKT